MRPYAIECTGKKPNGKSSLTALLAFERYDVSGNIPNLLIAERGPRWHCGAVHPISNGEECLARSFLLGPRRQGQISWRRVHALLPMAATIAVDAVANDAVGRVNAGAGLLCLTRRQQCRRRARFALTSRNGE